MLNWIEVWIIFKLLILSYKHCNCIKYRSLSISCALHLLRHGHDIRQTSHIIVLHCCCSGIVVIVINLTEIYFMLNTRNVACGVIWDEMQVVVVVVVVEVVLMICTPIILTSRKTTCRVYDNQRAIFYSFQQNNIEQPNIFGMVLFGN